MSHSPSRRQFLQIGGGCLAHVLLAAACAPRNTRARWVAPVNAVVATEPFAHLEAVGPGAWAVISTPLGGDRTTFANGGIIAGRNGVIAIEGFYRPAGATWLAQQARALTGRWPTHVIISHYHVDHASGLSGYEATGETTPRLHVTDSTRARVLSGAPVAPVTSGALTRAFADVVLVATTQPTFIDLGDRSVLLQPMRGHTASDLVVHDETSGVVFSGDIVWNGLFPNFVDARPGAWRESVTRVAALVTNTRGGNARLVPGHGGMVNAVALTRYADLLDDIERAGRAGHTAGQTPQQMAAGYVVPPSLGEWMAGKPSIERAMIAWAKELDAQRSR